MALPHYAPQNLVMYREITFLFILHAQYSVVGISSIYIIRTFSSLIWNCNYGPTICTYVLYYNQLCFKQRKLHANGKNAFFTILSRDY